eukprot:CAMPEP_0113894888 /NCGR_PEP_ID=MMETSP0780_2-20120614/17013_1 /TAXON_ID=652834 /ORGANISM="Palpitomonas bilix" /LENGTH=66 /DNA_ID=CAMNT_0000885569 /DNA_START=67 /DNA_END=267 /DNA_ORIENTATION=+ /assembly_acc=CAM_ASM_000599
MKEEVASRRIDVAHHPAQLSSEAHVHFGEEAQLPRVLDQQLDIVIRAKGGGPNQHIFNSDFETTSA